MQPNVPNGTSFVKNAMFEKQDQTQKKYTKIYFIIRHNFSTINLNATFNNLKNIIILCAYKISAILQVNCNNYDNMQIIII